MNRYVARRLLGFVPVLLGVALLVFLMLHLVPGDPVMLLFRQTDAIQNIPPEELALMRARYGLDRPLAVQFISYLARAVRGDLGESIALHGRVTDLISQEAPYTVELAVASLSFAVVFGILAGVLAAVRRATWIDTLSMFAATWGVAMPTFWVGLMAIIVFAVNLGWLPTSGQGSWDHLVLPSITLGTASAALIARLMRSSMLEVLSADYVRAARAKGAAENRIVFYHAFRNALIPVITVLGLQFGALLAGAVVTETVFARRGVGSLMVNAILGKDIPLAQGLILASAVTYLIVNLVVDLLYAIVDPRIAYY